MLTKSDIKLIQSLSQKKFREEQQLFVIEGEKIVGELMDSDFEIVRLFTTEAYEREHPKSERISSAELNKISHLKTPNRVLALAKVKTDSTANYNWNEGYTLVLDGISDPGNLGTLIRIADWFGIDKIVCSEDTVDVYNPKVVQATMGSMFRVSVAYTDLPTFLNKYREKIPVVGTLLNAKNINEVSISAPAFIVMGSESHGISKAVIKELTESLSIPGKGRAESLNVGVAAGIVCAKLIK
ncbi:MAG: TrmH family RNA methyltransferase [Flavobacteriales bacterium]